MKAFFVIAALGLVLAGCATATKRRAEWVGVIEGTVKTISFSGLTGSSPEIVIGDAYIAVRSPEFLRGQELLIGSSEDFPFREGDTIRIGDSASKFELEDGRLCPTSMYGLAVQVIDDKANK
jgi:hypothetical protein